MDTPELVFKDSFPKAFKLERITRKDVLRKLEGTNLNGIIVILYDATLPSPSYNVGFNRFQTMSSIIVNNNNVDERFLYKIEDNRVTRSKLIQIGRPPPTEPINTVLNFDTDLKLYLPINEQQKYISFDSKLLKYVDVVINEETKQEQEEEQEQEKQEQKQEKQQEQDKNEDDILDLSGVPTNCNTINTIYNDYDSQKRKFIKLIKENKSSKLVQKILDGTLKRLDGIRLVSLRGDAGARGCDPFPEWYEKNKLWFTKQFDTIKTYITEYNNNKPPKDRIVIPFDGRNQYTFSGGTRYKAYKRKRLNKNKTKRIYKKN